MRTMLLLRWLRMTFSLTETENVERFEKWSTHDRRQPIRSGVLLNLGYNADFCIPVIVPLIVKFFVLENLVTNEWIAADCKKRDSNCI